MRDAKRLEHLPSNLEIALDGKRAPEPIPQRFSVHQRSSPTNAGERRLVDHICASSNALISWLRQLEALKDAARGISLFLPHRFHRIDIGGSTRRDPRGGQARDDNHQQTGEVCDGIGDVHDRGNHRPEFGGEYESRQ